MREQFQLLLALQEVDNHLRALATEEQQLPQRLQTYEVACTVARQQLAAQRDAIEQSERQQRAFERELVGYQEALHKTQSKTHAVKTNAEYSALLAEMATGKQRLGALEDEILTLMEATDQQRQAHREQEQHVQAAIQTLAVQQQHIQQAGEALHRTTVAEQARRQHMVAQLDPALYTQYQKVTARHGGRGVAQLQEGVCSGCYLKIPPQLMSEIRLQTQLFTCPHCRLMLFWPA